jgi:hypothetical protein
MARPRGYQEPYGNEALRQLREWAGLTPAELADLVRRAGGRLSEQHVRNIESRGPSRVSPSQALVDQILAALHSDRETLERVRADITAAYDREPAPAPPRGAFAATPPAAQALGAPRGAPEPWSAPVGAAPPPGRRHRSAAEPPPEAAAPPPPRPEPTRRPRVAAPPAPAPMEAIGELGHVYEQLDDEGRHALLGFARKLLGASR